MFDLHPCFTPGVCSVLCSDQWFHKWLKYEFSKIFFEVKATSVSQHIRPVSTFQYKKKVVKS